MSVLAPNADAPLQPSQLFDAEEVAANLAVLAETYKGRERELRTSVAQRLKEALAQSRTEIERLLLKDRHGLRCAERICFVQDEIIRVLYEFTSKRLYPSQNPSEAFPAPQSWWKD